MGNFWLLKQKSLSPTHKDQSQKDNDIWTGQLHLIRISARYWSLLYISSGIQQMMEAMDTIKVQSTRLITTMFVPSYI